MKFKTLIAAVVLAAQMFTCACGSSGAEQTKKVSQENTEQTTSSEEEAEESLPDGIFSMLPEEAEEDLDYVAEVSQELFPDTSGKKMYGFAGSEELETADGVKTCYIFEFYTYKSKSYNKVATIAKDTESADIYLYNEETDSYDLTEIPEREAKWYEQATAALAKTSDSTAE